jgi:hypothetical protein
MSIKFGTTILFFLCVNLQRLAVGYECHREGQFVKVEPGICLNLYVAYTSHAFRFDSINPKSNFVIVTALTSVYFFECCLSLKNKAPKPKAH